MFKSLMKSVTDAVPSAGAALDSVNKSANTAFSSLNQAINVEPPKAAGPQPAGPRPTTGGRVGPQPSHASQSGGRAGPQAKPMGPPKQGLPPPMPTTSDLTPEERKIIEDVMRKAEQDSSQPTPAPPPQQSHMSKNNQSQEPRRGPPPPVAQNAKPDPFAGLSEEERAHIEKVTAAAQSGSAIIPAAERPGSHAQAKAVPDDGLSDAERRQIEEVNMDGVFDYINLMIQVMRRANAELSAETLPMQAKPKPTAPPARQQVQPTPLPAAADNAIKSSGAAMGKLGGFMKSSLNQALSASPVSGTLDVAQGFVQQISAPGDQHTQRSAPKVQPAKPALPEVGPPSSMLDGLSEEERLKIESVMRKAEMVDTGPPVARVGPSGSMREIPDSLAVQTDLEVKDAMDRGMSLLDSHPDSQSGPSPRSNTSSPRVNPFLQSQSIDDPKAHERNSNAWERDNEFEDYPYDPEFGSPSQNLTSDGLFDHEFEDYPFDRNNPGSLEDHKGHPLDSSRFEDYAYDTEVHDLTELHERDVLGSGHHAEDYPYDAYARDDVRHPEHNILPGAKRQFEDFPYDGAQVSNRGSYEDYPHDKDVPSDVSGHTWDRESFDKYGRAVADGQHRLDRKQDSRESRGSHDSRGSRDSYSTLDDELYDGHAKESGIAGSYDSTATVPGELRMVVEVIVPVVEYLPPAPDVEFQQIKSKKLPKRHLARPIPQRVYAPDDPRNPEFGKTAADNIADSTAQAATNLLDSVGGSLGSLSSSSGFGFGFKSMKAKAEATAKAAAGSVSSLSNASTSSSRGSLAQSGDAAGYSGRSQVAQPPAGPKPASSMPDLPDLSGLSDEERRQIEAVMMKANDDPSVSSPSPATRSVSQPILAETEKLPPDSMNVSRPAKPFGSSMSATSSQFSMSSTQEADPFAMDALPDMTGLSEEEKLHIQRVMAMAGEEVFQPTAIETPAHITEPAQTIRDNDPPITTVVTAIEQLSEEERRHIEEVMMMADREAGISQSSDVLAPVDSLKPAHLEAAQPLPMSAVSPVRSITPDLTGLSDDERRHIEEVMSMADSDLNLPSQMQEVHGHVPTTSTSQQIDTETTELSWPELSGGSDYRAYEDDSNTHWLQTETSTAYQEDYHEFGEDYQYDGDVVIPLYEAGTIDEVPEEFEDFYTDGTYGEPVNDRDTLYMTEQEILANVSFPSEPVNEGATAAGTIESYSSGVSGDSEDYGYGSNISFHSQQSDHLTDHTVDSTSGYFSEHKVPATIYEEQSETATITAGDTCESNAYIDDSQYQSDSRESQPQSQVISIPGMSDIDLSLFNEEEKQHLMAMFMKAEEMETTQLTSSLSSSQLKDSNQYWQSEIRRDDTQAQISTDEFVDEVEEQRRISDIEAEFAIYAENVVNRSELNANICPLCRISHLRDFSSKAEVCSECGLEVCCKCGRTSPAVNRRQKRSFTCNMCEARKELAYLNEQQLIHLSNKEYHTEQYEEPASTSVTQHMEPTQEFSTLEFHQEPEQEDYVHDVVPREPTRDPQAIMSYSPEETYMDHTSDFISDSVIIAEFPKQSMAQVTRASELMDSRTWSAGSPDNSWYSAAITQQTDQQQLSRDETYFSYGDQQPVVDTVHQSSQDFSYQTHTVGQNSVSGMFSYGAPDTVSYRYSGSQLTYGDSTFSQAGPVPRIEVHIPTTPTPPVSPDSEAPPRKIIGGRRRVPRDSDSDEDYSSDESSDEDYPDEVIEVPSAQTPTMDEVEEQKPSDYGSDVMKEISSAFSHDYDNLEQELYESARKTISTRATTTSTVSTIAAEINLTYGATAQSPVTPVIPLDSFGAPLVRDSWATTTTPSSITLVQKTLFETPSTTSPPPVPARRAPPPPQITTKLPETPFNPFLVTTMTSSVTTVTQAVSPNQSSFWTVTSSGHQPMQFSHEQLLAGLVPDKPDLQHQEDSSASAMIFNTFIASGSPSTQISALRSAPLVPVQDIVPINLQPEPEQNESGSDYEYDSEEDEQIDIEELEEELDVQHAARLYQLSAAGIPHMGHMIRPGPVYTIHEDAQEDSEAEFFDRGRKKKIRSDSPHKHPYGTNVEPKFAHPVTHYSSVSVPVRADPHSPQSHTPRDVPPTPQVVKPAVRLRTVTTMAPVTANDIEDEFVLTTGNSIIPVCSGEYITSVGYDVSYTYPSQNLQTVTYQYDTFAEVQATVTRPQQEPAPVAYTKEDQRLILLASQYSRDITSVVSSEQYYAQKQQQDVQRATQRLQPVMGTKAIYSVAPIASAPPISTTTSTVQSTPVDTATFDNDTALTNYQHYCEAAVNSLSSSLQTHALPGSGIPPYDSKVIFAKPVKSKTTRSPASPSSTVDTTSMPASTSKRRSHSSTPSDLSPIIDTSPSTEVDIEIASNRSSYDNLAKLGEQKDELMIPIEKQYQILNLLGISASELNRSTSPIRFEVPPGVLAIASTNDGESDAPIIVDLSRMVVSGMPQASSSTSGNQQLGETPPPKISAVQNQLVANQQKQPPPAEPEPTDDSLSADNAVDTDKTSPFRSKLKRSPAMILNDSETKVGAATQTNGDASAPIGQMGSVPVLNLTPAGATLIFNGQQLHLTGTVNPLVFMAGGSKQEAPVPPSQSLVAPAMIQSIQTQVQHPQPPNEVLEQHLPMQLAQVSAHSVMQQQIPLAENPFLMELDMRRPILDQHGVAITAMGRRKLPSVPADAVPYHATADGGVHLIGAGDAFVHGGVSGNLQSLQHSHLQALNGLLEPLAPLHRRSASEASLRYDGDPQCLPPDPGIMARFPSVNNLLQQVGARSQASSSQELSHFIGIPTNRGMEFVPYDQLAAIEQVAQEAQQAQKHAETLLADLANRISGEPSRRASPTPFQSADPLRLAGGLSPTLVGDRFWSSSITNVATSASQLPVLTSLRSSSTSRLPTETAKFDFLDRAIAELRPGADLPPAKTLAPVAALHLHKIGEKLPLTMARVLLKEELRDALNFRRKQIEACEIEANQREYQMRQLMRSGGTGRYQNYQRREDNIPRTIKSTLPAEMLEGVQVRRLKPRKEIEYANVATQKAHRKLPTPKEAEVDSYRAYLAESYNQLSDHLASTYESLSQAVGKRRTLPPEPRNEIRGILKEPVGMRPANKLPYLRDPYAFATMRPNLQDTETQTLSEIPQSTTPSFLPGLSRYLYTTRITEPGFARDSSTSYGPIGNYGDQVHYPEPTRSYEYYNTFGNQALNSLGLAHAPTPHAATAQSSMQTDMMRRSDDLEISRDLTSKNGNGISSEPKRSMTAPATPTSMSQAKEDAKKRTASTSTIDLSDDSIIRKSRSRRHGRSTRKILEYVSDEDDYQARELRKSKVREEINRRKQRMATMGQNPLYHGRMQPTSHIPTIAVSAAGYPTVPQSHNSIYQPSQITAAGVGGYDYRPPVVDAYGFKAVPATTGYDFRVPVTGYGQYRPQITQAHRAYPASTAAGYQGLNYSAATLPQPMPYSMTMDGLTSNPYAPGQKQYLPEAQGIYGSLPRNFERNLGAVSSAMNPQLSQPMLFDHHTKPYGVANPYRPVGRLPDYGDKLPHYDLRSIGHASTINPSMNMTVPRQYQDEPIYANNRGLLGYSTQQPMLPGYNANQRDMLQQAGRYYGPGVPHGTLTKNHSLSAPYLPTTDRYNQDPYVSQMPQQSASNLASHRRYGLSASQPIATFEVPPYDNLNMRPHGGRRYPTGNVPVSQPDDSGMLSHYANYLSNKYLGGTLDPQSARDRRMLDPRFQRAAIAAGATLPRYGPGYVQQPHARHPHEAYIADPMHYGTTFPGPQSNVPTSTPYQIPHIRPSYNPYEIGQVSGYPRYATEVPTHNPYSHGIPTVPQARPQYDPRIHHVPATTMPYNPATPYSNSHLVHPHYPATSNYGQKMYPATSSYGHQIHPATSSYGQQMHPVTSSYGQQMHPVTSNYGQQAYPATSSYGQQIYPATSSYGQQIYPATSSYGQQIYPATSSYGQQLHPATSNYGQQIPFATPINGFTDHNTRNYDHYYNPNHHGAHPFVDGSGYANSAYARQPNMTDVSFTPFASTNLNRSMQSMQLPPNQGHMYRGSSGRHATDISDLYESNIRQYSTIPDPNINPNMNPNMNANINANTNTNINTNVRHHYQPGPNQQLRGQIKRILLTRDARDKKGNGLGMKVIGGKIQQGSNQVGSFVSKIYKGGSVDLRGEIKEGDQILEWNGVDLTGKSHEEVQGIISQSDGEVEALILSGVAASQPVDSGESLDKGYESAPDNSHASNHLLSGNSGQHPSVYRGNPNTTNCAPITTTERNNNTMHTLTTHVVGQRNDYENCASPCFSTTPRTSPGINMHQMDMLTDGMVGELKVRILFDDSDQTLLATIVRARNLPLRCDSSNPNPFVKVYLLPGRIAEHKRRTKFIPNTANPVWTQTVAYKDLNRWELRNYFLEFSVWDYDPNNTNRFLGEILVTLGDMGSVVGKGIWYNIYPRHSYERLGRRPYERISRPYPALAYEFNNYM